MAVPYPLSTHNTVPCLFTPLPCCCWDMIYPYCALLFIHSTPSCWAHHPLSKKAGAISTLLFTHALLGYELHTVPCCSLQTLLDWDINSILFPACSLHILPGSLCTALCLRKHVPYPLHSVPCCCSLCALLGYSSFLPVHSTPCWAHHPLSTSKYLRESTCHIHSFHTVPCCSFTPCPAGI